MLEPLTPETLGQPCYEVIKRDDLTGAFQEAMVRAMTEILERIDNLIDIFTLTQPSALWVWDYSSRWDFDMFW